MVSLAGSPPRVLVATEAHEPSIRGFRLDGILCVPKASTEWFSIAGRVLPRRILLPPDAPSPRGYLEIPGHGPRREAILSPRFEFSIEGEDVVVVIPAWPDAAA